MKLSGRRMLSITLLLMLLAVAMAPPAAGASGGGGVTPPLRTGDPAIRLLSSDDTGVTFEVAVPWQELSVEPVTIGGKEYVRVTLPGWSSTGEAGQPELPFLAQAIGAPFGADVTVRATPDKVHTIVLPAAVVPVASQVTDWTPPAEGAASALPQPVSVVEEDAAIYAAAAAYPAALAAVTSDGVLRQQRMIGIAAYPVQVNPATRELTVYESLTVRVNFSLPPSAFTDPQDRFSPSVESEAYEQILQGELLNYQAARGWRQSPSSFNDPQIASSFILHPSTAATPWAPPAPGWRIKVGKDGFYKLTYAALSTTGLPVTTLDPRTFRLYYLGAQVAIHVEGQADGVFNSADYILFYGQAVASRYTADNIYWLTYGGAQGQRMTDRDGTPGTALSPPYYEATRRLEGSTAYITDIPGGDTQDHWLWDYVYPPSRPLTSTTFSLAAPYTGAYTAIFRFALYGGLDFPASPDHHTQVSLNGTLMEDAWWDGRVLRTTEMAFPQSLLVAGDNTITVSCPNDTGIGADLVYLDWVEVEFANTFTAVGDELAFGAGAVGSSKYQVAGFASNLVDVYDVSNPAAVVRITNVSMTQSGPPYVATFQDTPTATTGYWALSNNAYHTVEAEEMEIETDTPSNLAATTNGADWIAITHADFSSQAAALRDHRASQGLRAVRVDVQDVYDEFSYGIVSPAAIHDFLAYAYSQWQAPAPSYVVLVGDGHYDPKDYLRYGRTSYIPPYLAPVDPWIGETAADNRYVVLSGTDTLPDMMLGRLPVNSVADTSTLVNKIISYEDAPPTGAWRQKVLAVADNADDAGNFAQMSDALLNTYLPAPYTASKVYYGVTHTTVASARAAISSGINAGALIVNYMGHAAPNQWADEGLFKTADVSSLANGAMTPVMLPMTCYDGFYHYPYPLSYGYESVGEVVTRVSGKGAVASWSPTGLGVATGHDYLDKGFFNAIFTNHAGTVGAGTAAGKLNLYASGSNLDLLDTYLLFGDPATRLPTACAAPAGAVNDVAISRLSATEAQLGWGAVSGALLYQVWWKGNDFYFTPGASCTEANGCAWRSAPSFTHAAGLGNTGVNNSYVVLPVSACGAAQTTPSNRTGEFDFALTPGN